MITGMREQYQQVDWLHTFEVRRSSYSYRRDRANRVQPDRERLKARVIAIHEDSRQAQVVEQ
ncbi:hypothetical protein JYU12_00700 [bacterium AH-315-K03]|nr:hypothetical protein [bacterium AH-315-K03]